jgi:hypothetical protein
MSAILCEIGLLDDGRRHFELLAGELPELPNDYSTLAILASAAIACAHLRDAARAERLHALMAPYGEQFVSTGSSWLGAVAHHLALLSATMCRSDEAAAHFAAAERAYERLGAQTWLARCRLDWAETLLASVAAADDGRAVALLDRARASLHRLELPAMQRRAAVLRERASGG